MSINLLRETIYARYEPKEKFDYKNFRHVLVVTIAAIPLTSMLILLALIIIARVKAAGHLPFL